jgi:hypothetical protein
LITAILLGIVALLSCGGLFLLVAPRSAPDALAELKQIPLYTGAQGVSYVPNGRLANMPGAAPGTGIGFDIMIGYTTTGSTIPSITSSEAVVSFDTSDEPQKVFAYYLGEFDKIGWDCYSTGVGAGTGSGTAHCTRRDLGFPELAFTGFQGAPPWVEIRRSSSIRSVLIYSYKVAPDTAQTRVDIEYQVLVAR